MSIYKQNKIQNTSIKLNQSYAGESLEFKIARILNNNEPITDGAPIIYTERKNGIEAAYNIRTDRFELAVEAMDKVSASYVAKREQAIGERTFDTMTDQQKKEFHTKFPNNKHKPVETGGEGKA